MAKYLVDWKIMCTFAPLFEKSTVFLYDNIAEWSSW